MFPQWSRRDNCIMGNDTGKERCSKLHVFLSIVLDRWEANSMIFGFIQNVMLWASLLGMVSVALRNQCMTKLPMAFHFRIWLYVRILERNETVPHQIIPIINGKGVFDGIISLPIWSCICRNRPLRLAKVFRAEFRFPPASERRRYFVTGCLSLSVCKPRISPGVAASCTFSYIVQSCKVVHKPFVCICAYICAVFYV